MSESLSTTEELPSRGVYAPPPSRLGSVGFGSFAAKTTPEAAAAADDPWLDTQPETGSLSMEDAAAQSVPPVEPVCGPRPARAVNWRDFDQIVLGPDSGDLVLSPVAAPYERMARASLVISLLGIVTGAGFLVGAVMGQIALRRMGRAGWFECNEPARRRARNAVMIGCTGTAVLATAALLVAGWWLVQTPLETLVPAPGAGDTPPGGAL